MHDIEQLLLGNIGIQSYDARVQAGLLAGGCLVAYVDLRGGVFPHQHHGQAGHDACRLEILYPLGDVGLDGVGQGLAIDNTCGHAVPSALVSAIFMRSATVVTSSFSMILARCASTVLMLMFKSPAICLFRRPATMRSSTCCSRAVKRLSTAWWFFCACTWVTLSAACSSMR